MPRDAIALRWEQSDAYATRDGYPELRELLAPEYSDLPPERIEQILQGAIGEVSPEDLENFWKGLQKFGRAAAPILQQALPVAATVAGTALGGPVGAMVGGAAGNALSGALGAATRGPARGRTGRILGGLAGGAVQGLTGTAGGGTPAAAPAAGTGSPAAAQLLRMITRPETAQALLSMVMGGAGRRQVPVGGTPVPVGAVANLLGVLANQAAAEHREAVAGEAAGTPVYLLDRAGEFIADPADPIQRAEVLLMRFAEADALPVESDEYDRDFAPEAYQGWEEAQEEALDDALVLADLEGVES